MFARGVGTFALAAIMTACSPGFTEITPGPDATSDVEGGSPDSSVDAALDAGDSGPAPACNLDAPFDPPELVPGVNGESQEVGGRLSPDARSIYFASQRNGTSFKLFFATRGTADGPFENVTLLENVNGSEGDDTMPTLTDDGMTMYFQSDRDKKSAKIYEATRKGPGEPFGVAEPVVEINTPDDGRDEAPFITGDGATLYFASGRGGDLDIYRSHHRATGFSSPELVSELRSSDADSYPVLTADRLTIFFSSTRSGGDTKGAYDIWTARRKSTSDKFEDLSVVPELSSEGEDFVTWVAPDGCAVYLHSDRNGKNEIFVARRPK